MQEKVIITGGTGLVGKHLTAFLQAEGYEIGILTRGKTRYENGLQYYHWDIKNKLIDEQALVNTTYIINLVGAGVAEEKWTDKRKKEILDSRTHSTNLLYNKVKEGNISLKGFICASAIGIYGNFSGDTLKTEDSVKGTDFLAKVVIDWEKAAKQFETLDVRTVLMRIGIVLESNGGALAKIAQPIKLGAGAPLGTGKQYMSWVHMDDLVRMFSWAISNKKAKGPYNAVNPNPVTNKEFTKLTAKALRKPLFLPNVPAFMLKLMLGEMSSIVLGGINVSPKKMMDEGFKHQYLELSNALENLLKK